MSKKKKQHKPPPLSVGQLAERCRRALDEKRSQSALEYAKDLHKRQPSPDHEDLLQEAYLLRAEQLLEQGALEDAGTVLTVALEFAPDDKDWSAKLAPLLARAGRGDQAIKLLDKLPASSQSSAIYEELADNAIVKGDSARAKLPAVLQDDFDRVRRAFIYLEKGQDDECRAQLQGIGLRSPFAEWKLLVRGLLAYYHKDDARARENWQRLDVERVPGRLIAPLRIGIDPSFLEKQSRQTQEHLQNQAKRLEGASAAANLRMARSGFINGGGNRNEGYRRLEMIAPILRRDAPRLWARLKRFIYWQIPDGDPREIPRFKQIFGPVEEDPEFTRLKARGAEVCGNLRSAHLGWLGYEAELEKDPSRWGANVNDRVRALVWIEIGRIGIRHNDEGDGEGDLELLYDAGVSPNISVSPTPAECFRRAQSLAPDLLIAYSQEVAYFLQENDMANAEKAAERLLEHFPDHDASLQTLATIYLQKGTKLDKAAKLLQRALERKPLDRNLRTTLSKVFRKQAHKAIEAKRFPKAREACEAALSNVTGSDAFPLLCQWASLEFLDEKEMRAEELVSQAEEKAKSPLAVSYEMLVQCILSKLPKPIKKRFDKEFKDRVKKDPTVADVGALCLLFQQHLDDKLSYHGQKTHEKNLRSWLDRAPIEQFSERELVSVCQALDKQGVKLLLRRFADSGSRRFPKNPHFPLANALSYLDDNGEWTTRWPTGRYLLEARERAQSLPSTDPEKLGLLELIEGHLEDFYHQFPFASPMGQLGMMARRMFGGPIFDDDFDDDDDGDGETDE